MSDNESVKKDAESPDAAQGAPQPLDDESLDNVAGGMRPAVPRVDRADALSSLSTPVCLSQT